MDTNFLIIIFFFILMFIGVWLTAEYNTMTAKKAAKEHAKQLNRLNKEIETQEVALKKEKDKVGALQNSRLEAQRLGKELKNLEAKHQLLYEEHRIFLDMLKKMKRQCQRTEFNGSHLSRLVINDIDKLFDVEKELKKKKVQIIDKDTEKMFSRIQEKLANK